MLEYIFHKEQLPSDPRGHILLLPAMGHLILRGLPLPAVVLRLKQAPKFPRGLVKVQTVRFHPQLSDSLGLGSGLRICISNKSPGAADCWSEEHTLDASLTRESLEAANCTALWGVRGGARRELQKGSKPVRPENQGTTLTAQL